MTRNLVRQNTRRTQSQEAHNAKYNALAERCEKASAKHDKPEAEVARRKKGPADCRIHRPAGKATASLEEWDSQVWSLLPEKGTVKRDGSILAESKAQAKVIRNAARYLTGEAKEGVIIGGNTTNNRTYDQSSSITLTGNTFSIRDEQDIYALAAEIATLTKRQQRGKGLRMA